MKYSTIGYILGQVLKFEGIFYAASVSDRNDLSRKRSVFLPYYRDHLFCPRMPDHVKK